MTNNTEQDVLKRIDFECIRLQDFASCARNQCAFESMVDIRDAACMHLLWLNDLVSKLSDSSKTVIGVTARRLLTECVNGIQHYPPTADWGQVFHFCASTSWEVQEQVRYLMGACDTEQQPL